MKRLCIVSTVELPVVAFMVPHLKALQEIYELTVVVNTANRQFLTEYGITALVIPFSIERKISLTRDLLALFSLFRLFRTNRFDLVLSIAPKAGLLAMVAAVAAGIPHRIHIFTGQVWATAIGLRRSFLKAFDRMIAMATTGLLTDSHSQREFLVREGIASADKLVVLGNGSVSGVDPDRFKFDVGIREQVRQECGIPDDAMLFLFLGRLTKDKGILDLTEAFTQLSTEGIRLWMLLVGPDEEGMRSCMKNFLGAAADNVRYVGYTRTPERYMTASDVLCLPSYREGFGMVILEAAAMGIPSIASRIYGITDAVIDGKTGLLHEAGNVTELTDLMRNLFTNKELRDRLGLQAQKRAYLDFSQSMLVVAMQEYHQKCLNHHE